MVPTQETGLFPTLAVVSTLALSLDCSLGNHFFTCTYRACCAWGTKSPALITAGCTWGCFVIRSERMGTGSPCCQGITGTVSGCRLWPFRRRGLFPVEHFLSSFSWLLSSLYFFETCKAMCVHLKGESGSIQNSPAHFHVQICNSETQMVFWSHHWWDLLIFLNATIQILSKPSWSKSPEPGFSFAEMWRRSFRRLEPV